MDIDTTRGYEYSQLTKWLNLAEARDGVSLIGISGYGGIGKSYLLNEALRQYHPSESGYCEIRVDGSDRSRVRDFTKLLSSGFAPQRLVGGNSKKDYFPQTRKLENSYNKLLSEADKEFEKKNLSDDLQNALKYMLKLGVFLNRSVPLSKQYLDIEFMHTAGVGDHIDTAFELFSDLDTLKVSSWGPLGDLFGANYAKRLRNDFFELAADSYTADIASALAGYRSSDWMKLSHGKIRGLKNLLIVIDDFEILGKALAEFLVSNLIPQLDRADFKTTIIIVGRDDMKDSHIGFQHHHTNKIVGSLRLEKLPIETAKMMLISAGYNPNEADQLASYTDGYPFLVSVLCETKDRSVTFYQRFYDRTTRWMSDVEKEWVIPLCYLGRVDLQTIPLVLPNIDASIVMDWFKREASLRDPDESYYVISPLIRKMICEYNARYVGSVEHEAIKNKAQASAKIQDDGVENLSL